MKIITSLALFFILNVFNSFSTPQINDVLIFEGDTLVLYPQGSPLRDHSESLALNQKNHEISTACWRGYIAEWIIRNDSLYLSKIQSCNSGKDIKIVAETVLEQNFKNDLMHARWFNGDFWSGKQDVNNWYYKNEYHFSIINGNVTKSKQKSTENCPYNSSEKIKEYLLNNFDWCDFTVENNEVISFNINITPDLNGEIKNVDMKNNSKYILNSQFTQTLEMIPCTTGFLYDGKYLSIPVEFEFSISLIEIAPFLE